MTTEVSDWGPNPADNADFPDYPMGEGMTPAQLNDSIRGIMAAIQRGVALNDLSNVDVSGAVTALGLGAAVTGDVKMAVGEDPTGGWVLCDGETVGAVSSNATSRANADTVGLFTFLWDNTANADITVQDSAGTPTVRGATAAADFAVSKRMPLPDFRGRFPRGLDNGATVDPDPARGMLSVQDDAFEAHTHTGDVTSTAGLGRILQGSAASDAGDYTTGSTGGTETRPKNIAINFFIKL